MSSITGPAKAAAFFRQRMSDEVEEVWVAALDCSLKITAAQCLFRGTVDRCLVHPRDIFRFACVQNASSIVVAHNHPSGNVEPSTEDLRWTRSLLEAAELLMIPLQDHLIVGRDDHFSFRAAGLIAKSDHCARRETDEMAQKGEQKE